jgi:hypothetical protein
MTPAGWLRAYEREKEKEITEMLDSNGEPMFDDIEFFDTYGEKFPRVDDMPASCCDDVPASCCDDVFPASCCDASFVLKTLILVLMLMMLQPL